MLQGFEEERKINYEKNEYLQTQRLSICPSFPSSLPTHSFLTSFSSALPCLLPSFLLSTLPFLLLSPLPFFLLYFSFYSIFLLFLFLSFLLYLSFSHSIISSLYISFLSSLLPSLYFCFHPSPSFHLSIFPNLCLEHKNDWISKFKY